MGSRIAWFAAGLTVGTAIGMMVAPVPGAEARRLLARKTDRGKQFLAESGRDFLETTRDLYDRGCQLADEASDLFEEGRRIANG